MSTQKLRKILNFTNSLIFKIFIIKLNRHCIENFYNPNKMTFFSCSFVSKYICTKYISLFELNCQTSILLSNRKFALMYRQDKNF